MLETQSTIRDRIYDLARSPIALTFVFLIAWVALAFSTDGLFRTRALLSFFNKSGSDRLVTITTPSPFFLVAEPVPGSQAASWMEGTSGLEVIGRWRIERKLIEANSQRVFKRVMLGDEAVLDLLGFSARDRISTQSRASCEILLRSDLSLPLKNSMEVTLDGQLCSVALLKQSTGIPSPDFDAFVRLNDGYRSAREYGVFARRQASVTPDQVAAELRAPVNTHPGWGNPAVSSLANQFSAILKWVVVINLLSIALVLLRCRVKSVWGLVLLSVRAFLLLSLPSAVCVELVVARSHLVEAVGIDPVVSAIGWLGPLATCGVLAWWLIQDHSLRCPVCQHCLAEPLWIGCLGSTIFEPFGTEWLCLAGHGRLLESNSIALGQQPVWLS